MSIKLNIIANYISSIWSALSTIIFAPIFLSLLGVEAYGLIGVFVVLQSALVVFDGGLGVALNRSMAHYSAGIIKPSKLRDLLKSVEYVIVVLGLILSVICWVISQWLSINWLNIRILSIAEVSNAITIMGILLLFRLIDNIYRAGLLGLSHQIEVSCLTILFSTLRTAGVAGIMMLTEASIQTFFLSQLIIAGASLLSTRLLLYRILPVTSTISQFSMTTLMEIRGFSGGILGISALALLLNQLDKIIILKMSILSEFSYYSLAVAAAAAVTLPAGPILSALLPRVTALIARGEDQKVINLFHNTSRAISALIAPIALVLIEFSEPVVYLWTGNLEIAKKVAPLLSIYTLGCLFSGLVSTPYMFQIANGWTSLTLKINTISVMLFGVLLVIFVPRYGALGACWIWAILNLGFILIIPTIMHKKILQSELITWCLFDIALPLSLAIVIVSFANYFWTMVDYKEYSKFIIIIFTLFITLITVPIIRKEILIPIYDTVFRCVKKKYHSFSK